MIKTKETGLIVANADYGIKGSRSNSTKKFHWNTISPRKNQGKLAP